MKKRQRISLAELRSGQPVLSNGHPAKWLVEAVGQEVAEAAVLFDALTIDLEPEAVRVRLGGERRAA